MTDFETHPVGTAARIEQLEAALTRANAATAAAYEVAAKEINDRGAVEQENFGLGRATQNFFRARNIIRALATPDQTAALDRLIAEAEARVWKEAAEIAIGYHRRAIDWVKTVKGLDHLIGETDSSRIYDAILAASKKGGA